MEPAGDANQAGPEIEKYLSLFRETMNRRAGTQDYSDLSVGYAWCGAFAYYCCLKAGFRISGFTNDFYSPQHEQPEAALLLVCDVPAFDLG